MSNTMRDDSGTIIPKASHPRARFIKIDDRTGRPGYYNDTYGTPAQSPEQERAQLRHLNQLLADDLPRFPIGDLISALVIAGSLVAIIAVAYYSK